MQNLTAVNSADLAGLRARMAADVECPRCLEVSCLGWCRDTEVADEVEEARREEDADLVSVGHWGSDEPMRVAREGVSLEVDEAQWHEKNAVGLGLTVLGCGHSVLGARPCPTCAVFADAPADVEF